VTESRHTAELLAKARRCRRLARDVLDKAVTRTLNQMADEFEAKARDFEASRSRRSAGLVA
jgi:hypothetical protein